MISLSVLVSLNFITSSKLEFINAGVFFSSRYYVTLRLHVLKILF